MNHRLVKGFLAEGSHNVIVRTIDKKPRSYQAVCVIEGCTYGDNGTAWKSPVGTGSVADTALIEHRNQTLKDAGKDLEALGAIPKPKQPRGKAKASAPVAQATATVANPPADPADNAIADPAEVADEETEEEGEG
jgi:hypothetical protein